jgi:hypothetical protein
LVAKLGYTGIDSILELANFYLHVHPRCDYIVVF